MSSRIELKCLENLVKSHFSFFLKLIKPQIFFFKFHDFVYILLIKHTERMKSFLQTFGNVSHINPSNYFACIILQTLLLESILSPLLLKSLSIWPKGISRLNNQPILDFLISKNFLSFSPGGIVVKSCWFTFWYLFVSYQT